MQQPAPQINPTMPVPPTPPNPLIVTGSGSAMQFGQNSQLLNQMLGNLNTGTSGAIGSGGATPLANSSMNPDGTPNMNYTDSYTQALDKLSANSDKATQNLIATIKSQKASRILALTLYWANSRNCSI